MCSNNNTILEFNSAKNIELNVAVECVSVYFQVLCHQDIDIYSSSLLEKACAHTK